MKIVKKGFDSEPVYNEKCPRTRTSYYEGKIGTNFYGYKIPKKDFQCICFSVIIIGSAFRNGENYYSEVF